MQQMNLLGRVLKYIQSTELPIKMFYGCSANWETNENKKQFYASGWSINVLELIN